jgi:predicted PurR-regulated permease PerM
VGGLTAFGLQGVLLGPLLVCVLIVGRDVLTRTLSAQTQTRARHNVM